MAGKRILKKKINQLTYELAAECYTYRYFHEPTAHEKSDQVLEELVKFRNELVHRINYPESPEDYKKNRTYFRNIAEDLKKMVSLMDGLG